MHGVLTWLAAALIIAILLGATIATAAAHVDRKRREHRHRRPRPRSWDHIEEQWPSPAALDGTGSMILGEEIGWRRSTGSPLMEPADFAGELPFPELLDDLPDDPDWPARIRAALDDEEQERLAQTGELRAIADADDVPFGMAEFTGLASQAPALTGDWTPRPDPGDDDLDDPALDQSAEFDEPERCVVCGVTVGDSWCPGCGEPICSPCEATGQLRGRQLDDYLDDLDVLTRYRIAPTVG